ncbi:aminotransferase class V-fold PLP-dependent enzyme [Holdemania massiliensis]
MNVYPLENITLQQAMQKQFRLVDCITRYFSGSESLTRGDLGVRQPGNQPLTTHKAEQAIAAFFGAEDCILVRGSGTGAIRYGLSAMVKPQAKILIHQAPAYSTTQTSFEMFGLIAVEANFNDQEAIVRTLKENPDICGALVQHSRQKIDDRYDLAEVITVIKQMADIPVLIDDNYGVMKVDRIGCECGADLSCFSTFKLQGPEGIGCVVGKQKYIERIRKMHYSGGSQTQGWEALEVLRGLTLAPVMLALADQAAKEALSRIQAGEIAGIKNVYLANAQSKVLLIELREPIAKKVLAAAEKHGALPNPVGAESKYELAPMFYRVSGTFLRSDPTYADTMIRINPNRAGAETILRILAESIQDAQTA